MITIKNFRRFSRGSLTRTLTRYRSSKRSSSIWVLAIARIMQKHWSINTINVLDILNHDKLIMTREAVKQVEEVYAE